MDNQIPVDPVSDAGQAPIDGQSPTDQTQPQDGGTAPGKVAEPSDSKEAFPWETDERFKGKTPDDMFKIVAEADKYKGELSKKAKVADLLSEKFGVTPERMQEIIQQREVQQKQAFYQANPQAEVKDELEHLKSQLAEQQQQQLIQQEDSKLDNFLSENPEYKDFREEIRKLGYSVERDSDWETVAKTYFGRAIEKGQASAYEKMGVKQVTQSSGVSNSAPKGRPTIEEMSNMSSKELEALLP